MGLLGILGAGIEQVPMFAQRVIVPDDTLGEERSQLRQETIRGVESYRIEGGARRDGNLFHSFSQFGMEAGRGAYFSNPTGVENIFSRITGNAPSDIQGTLGVIGEGTTDVLGTANLFLMNPNGIVFGQNARLDLGGSFVGTTAETIGFGDVGVFDATSPGIPSQVLTVNPSAFLFNRIPVQSIKVQGESTGRTDNYAPTYVSRLQVPPGKSLLLLGGEIMLQSAGLWAPGGLVGLVAIAGSGTVALTTDHSESLFLLTIPQSLARANISLEKDSSVDASDRGGGNIIIDARNISLSGGSSVGVNVGFLGAGNGQTGDVTLRATEKIAIEENVVLYNISGNQIIPGSQGNLGNINLEADSIESSYSFILNQAFTFGEDTLTGNSGNIRFRANSINFEGTPIIANTEGIGNAGEVSIDADSVVLRGSDISTGVTSNARGTGGNIRIDTRSLSLRNSDVGRPSRIITSTSGQGQGGNITINTESIDISRDINEVKDGFRNNDSNGLIATSESSAGGQGGNITINANHLILSNGAFLTTETRGSFPAGSIHIDADRLEVLNGAQIRSNTEGQGNAGNITVNSNNSVTLSGIDPNFLASVNRFGDPALLNRNRPESGLFAATSLNSSGNGGTIHVTTPMLYLADQAQISVQSQGSGSAGIIDLYATDLSLVGRSQISAATTRSGNAGRILVQRANLVELSNSSISTGVDASAVINSANTNNSANPTQIGNIEIQARSLALRSGANITASTDGQGNAGNVLIQNANSVALVDRSSISTTVNSGAVGRGGNITIDTGLLRLNRESEISSNTAGTGDTGMVSITAADKVELGARSRITNNVNRGATGDAQSIEIETPRLTLVGNSEISAATSGNGRAGNIFVQAPDAIMLSHSNISTAVNQGAIVNVTEADQRGGIELQTRSLSLRNDAAITANTEGQGNAGNITIRGVAPIQEAERLLLNNRSRISTAVSNPEAIGEGGNITIQGEQIALNNRAQVIASTQGRGEAGLISVAADTLNIINGGQVRTSTESTGNAGEIILNTRQSTTIEGNNSGIFTDGATGQGGTITLNTTNLMLRNQAEISARSQGSGQAGNIIIRANNGQFSAMNSSIITNADESSGGDIQVDARQIFLQHNSKIQTDVQQGSGGGGNIDLTADTILAFDNSSILASAPPGEDGGRGGDITLNTPAFFASDDVVLDASGEEPGRILQPDVNFISNSLSQLQGNSIDTEALLSNSCIQMSREQSGRFIVTGAEGLPLRPGNSSAQSYATGTIRPVPVPEPSSQTEPPNVNSTVGHNRRWQIGEPIVEPQGIYQLLNGKLVMSRECS
jgi:filamentous hemagglutinin family protein